LSHDELLEILAETKGWYLFTSTDMHKTTIMNTSDNSITTCCRSIESAAPLEEMLRRYRSTAIPAELGHHRSFRYWRLYILLLTSSKIIIWCSS
jgi:hypothetical protein